MADDFYLQAGSQRLAQIEAERAAALADLAAHKANGDRESAAAAIQQIANIDVEMANLNQLYTRYVQSQNPPAPPQPSKESRAKRTWEEMDWQDVVDMTRESKYAKNIRPDDPNLIAGWNGRGNLIDGETVLNKLFDGHMAGPRSVAVSGLRALGEGSVTAGRKVLEEFLARASSHQQDAAEYQQGGDVHYERPTQKATKAEAHYRPGNSNRRCEICTMFVEPDQCTAVKGEISPGALCDYFERDKEAE
jgi:hypothetical protein